MRFQCSCGAHYELQVTPEMAAYPVPFVCGVCGVDGSDYVTQLARAELGVPAPSAEPSPPASAPVAQALPLGSAAAAARGASTSTAAAPRLRVHVEAPPPPQPATAAADVADEFPRCLKHGGEIAHEKCYVCSKPICPKCMELFGYVCSPLCKAKAGSHGIEIPVFEGQKSVVEARSWQKIVRIASIAGIALGLVIVVWCWYEFFAARPKPVFKTRFEDVAYSGQSIIAATNQILFLHGGTLGRHDMKQKKEVWAHYLVDKERIEREIKAEMKQMQKAIDKANSDHPDFVPKMPDPEKMRESMIRFEEAVLQLRAVGQNVWVISSDRITQYDWDTGKALKEVSRTNGMLIPRGNELLLVDERQGKEKLTRINLATAEVRNEDLIGGPGAGRQGTATASTGTGNGSGGGLPLTPGQDADKPLDPAKVAQQASQMSLPGKIALPAVLANSMSQQRTLNELNDGNRGTNSAKPQAKEPYLLIPTPDGFIRFSTKLLEEKIVTRVAMKAPPAKSALDGEVTVGKTGDIVNEQLNEWQREHGGDKVWENESRYRVKLSTPDGKDEWSGEVVGEPDVYPLQTVNVLTANKTLIVFDKSNKKLWQAALTYNVVGGREDPDAEDRGTAHGPCVEHKGALYVFDQGVLHAFNLANGEVRWRVVSVGIDGLYFDDHDMVYLTTTDATPERIKYSRQIDIRQQDNAVLMKLDPKTGKRLWSIKPFGQVAYISGKYIYTLSSYRIDDEEGDSFANLTGLSGTHPHVRIKRISQSTGKEMWDYYEPRGPVDVEFDKNSIRIVFKREVEVLRFLSL